MSVIEDTPSYIEPLAGSVDSENLLKGSSDPPKESPDLTVAEPTEVIPGAEESKDLVSSGDIIALSESSVVSPTLDPGLKFEDADPSALETPSEDVHTTASTEVNDST